MATGLQARQLVEQTISHQNFLAPCFTHDIVSQCDLLDDTALVANYNDDSSEGKLQLHLILRELRPPTGEERRAIISGIEMRHRSFLWTIMSRGVQMTSTIPAGTARESTLVRAITTRPFPEYDVGPLPDIVTTLLLAMCDPNEQGAPPRSPLGISPVRRKTAREVASPFPEVVEALQTAIYAAGAEKNPTEPSHGTTH